MNSMRARHALRVGFWLTVAALFTACGGMQARTESTLVDLSRDTYPVLVMVEPEMTFEQRPVDVYLRSYQVVQQLSTHHGLPVVAPWEVTVGEGEEWPTGQRHLASVVGDNGYHGADIYLLQLRIVENGTFRAVSRPEGMGGVSAHYTPEVLVELLLQHPFSRKTLLRSFIVYREDLFAASDDPHDMEDRPLLRDALTAVASAFAAEYRAVYTGGSTGRDPNFVGRYNGRQLFEFGGGVGPTLEATWGDLSEPERQIHEAQWLARLDPGITPTEALEFTQLQPGVLITDVDPAMAAAGIVRGDYIVAANNRPAYGQHVIRRAFLTTPRGGAVRLDVLRGGSPVRFYVTP